MTAVGQRTTLVGVLGLAVGVGIGLGLGVVGGERRDSTSRQLGAPNAPPAQADLAPALRELAQSLASLRATLEQPGVAPAPALSERRSVEEQTPVPSPDLAAAIAELASAVRALRTSSPGKVAETPRLVVPAWVNRRPAFAAAGLREAWRADDDEARERAFRAFQQRHLFWTLQQVVDAYGRPDEVSVDGASITWTYENKFEDGSQEQFNFYFHEGAVYSVDYDFDEP